MHQRCKTESIVENGLLEIYYDFKTAIKYRNIAAIDNNKLTLINIIIKMYSAFSSFGTNNQNNCLIFSFFFIKILSRIMLSGSS